MFSTQRPDNLKINFFSSLQGRLCLAITSALAVLILIYGLLAYTELEKDLMNTARETLEAQVLPPIHHSGIEQASDIKELREMAALLTSTLSLHGVKCMAFDGQGRVLSSPVDNTPRWQTNYQTSKSVFLIESSNPNLSPQLTYIIPIKTSIKGYETNYIIAWSSLEHVAKSLQTEGIFLLGGGLLVLFVAFFLIYILTSFILQPLYDLVETSRAVAANDLSARAPAKNTHDELAYLTTIFNQMLERLQDTFDSKEETYNIVRKNVADISHELRSPLTSVNGYVDVLQRGAVTEPGEKERVYSSIKRELSRLSRLVDNLLTLARLDSRLPGAMQPVDVANLIRESVRRIQLLDPERSINIEIEEDCIVWGESERLQQMINNLVDNAFCHNARETIIVIGCKSEGQTIKLWVKDNGKGISEQEIPLIFERFWRSSSSTMVRGSGLGLSIVKAVAENHGGKVEVRSTLGQGTSFIITLPKHICLQ